MCCFRSEVCLPRTVRGRLVGGTSTGARRPARTIACTTARRPHARSRSEAGTRAPAASTECPAHSLAKLRPDQNGRGGAPGGSFARL